MANTAHLKLLSASGKAWNGWRTSSPEVVPDLTSADLRKRNLREYDLSLANLDGADLRDVSFRRANLSGASLRNARLHRTYFGGCKLNQTDFSNSLFYETILSDVVLTRCIGLETVIHRGPSSVDFRTLARSKRLNRKFLQGCGLPDAIIDEAMNSSRMRTRYYSSFISYSSRDETFVSQLYSDLQERGVRCWFAPKDMEVGAKIRESLDEAIRDRDKVILVLSRHTMSSAWVEKEFETTFEEEQRRSKLILLPVRLDDSPLSAAISWVADIKRTRNIGDFCNWQDSVKYETSLSRLLEALQNDGS